MRPVGKLSRALRARRRPAPGRDPIAAALDELEPSDRKIVERCLPYTMTGVARLTAVVDAARYVHQNRVAGAFVECGVWRGGSVLAMILALQESRIENRDLYLFDTFEGMTEPTEHDVSRFDRPALETWDKSQGRPWSEVFGAAVQNEDVVRATLVATAYPASRIHLVKGRVEDTIPESAPKSIALLRLDTDWYESTRHEMEHLYPRLAPGGVLIIDDYGHWDGARRATDEYFAQNGPRPFMSRVDYTARLAVKPV
jgi:O-methyltransferase